MVDNPFEDLSIQLRLVAGGNEMEFRALTNVKADVFTDDGTLKIGKIRAWLIHRNRIPSGHFYTAFDGHSEDCYWIGSTLMEPKLGRTKLESLAPHDNNKSGFMIIDSFEIFDDYKNHSSSDIQAAALSQFLRHPSVASNVSTFAYVLEPEYDRQDANAFLRNGFFQDPAIALDGGGCERILVAALSHTAMPLKSQQAAASTHFVAKQENVDEPTEIDLELMNYIKKKCPNRYEVEDGVGADREQTAFEEVDRLVLQGASVRRSNALMAAVASDWLPLVEYLHMKDPSSLHSSDQDGYTPLMMSAVMAAGRSTKSGIAQTKVLDYLLSVGADKSTQDNNGMTAYGHFVKMLIHYDESIGSMMGKQLTAQSPANYAGHTE